MNAQGEASSIIGPHDIYQRLGTSTAARFEAYKALFRCDREPGMFGQIRKATNGNRVLGSERFAQEVAATLARRVTPDKSGRQKMEAPQH